MGKRGLVMADSYVIEGYIFQSRADYDQARKERETIAYLSAHSDMEDMKAVYKIYKTASEKHSFQTIFGLKYMEELRNRLINSEIVTEDVLDPIPIGKVMPSQVSKADNEAAEYRQSYEKARTGSIIKNLLIAVLLAVIAGMMFITYNSQYSVFTYFTNYKEDMRSEILNEYEEWESSLKEREEAVKKREQKLQPPSPSPDSVQKAQ